MTTNTMTKLQSVTVGSGGVSSVTFSNIPQTYTDLIIKASVRGNQGGVIYTAYRTTPNSSTAGFTYLYLQGDGASVSTSSSTSDPFWFSNLGSGATSNSNTFGNNEVYIPNYVSNVSYKMASSDYTDENNTSTAYLGFIGGLFNNTSPITSITMVPPPSGYSFLQYSTFTLYGVFNQDVSSAPSAPTIGTATDAGTNDSASITFTGVSGAASYTMTSSPSSITATGTTSPIVVPGLSLGTAYTFSCTATNPLGISGSSAASNSVTLAGVASYELLGTASLSGTSTTISGLPTSGYKHLQIFVMSQHSYTNYAGPVVLQFNGDAGSNYTYHQILSDYSQTAPIIYSTTATAGYRPGTHPGTYQSGYWGTYTIDVLDFLSPNKYKSIFSNGGDGGLSYPRNWLASGSWLNTSPINTVTISTIDGSFVTGSQAQVWGIR